jgi:arylsulfatase
MYNWIGLERYTVAASEPLAAGKATIKLDFAYDGGGPGKGGAASLSVNGKKLAEGRIEKTIPYVISTDEGADVGEDDDSPVSEDYVAGIKSRFTGKIEMVTIDVK